MIEDLIKYRLEQSEESLSEAELLFGAGKSHRVVVNRAYYAMFYAVLALLAREGKGTSKHKGVIAMFDANFVRPGVFPKEMSKALHRVFDLRQTGDYVELAQTEQKDAEEAIQSSREFIKAIKEYLQK